MITKINPMLLIDGYKTGHKVQYPTGTEYVYSNFTPRQSRFVGVDKVIFFGLQYLIKEYLIERWNTNFFNKPQVEILRAYKRRMDNYLGLDAIDIEHIKELHDLGYLPIEIKAIPEGTLVPIGVPVLTIINTIPKFFWLTNYLETLLSNIIWKPMTSATTAFQYRKKFEEYAELTGYDKGFIQWQGHDFSFRGMSGTEDALMSASGHLLSFTGTDTIPAIDFLELYYNANSDIELVGGSVPATEHSVSSLGAEYVDIEEDYYVGDEKLTKISSIPDDFNVFKRLIIEVYPNGIVSIVSDTFNFWKVMTEYLPALKDEILNRDGRLVIRPDSGDPVNIICGYEIPSYLGENATSVDFYNHCETGIDGNGKKDNIYEFKGAYELLWDVFGGTINEKGYKVLNPKVGLIYGDSIIIDRQQQILQRLEQKGFSASNLVLGIGSFTYEYVTRDTFGMAMKATWGQVNGVEKNIFKNPKTDSGFKKSAKGLLCVYRDEENNLKLKDQCTHEEENNSLLTTVFKNGKLIRETSLSEIRSIVQSQLNN